jgi:tetrapyrrole methylase family protein/MazG family protein
MARLVLAIFYGQSPAHAWAENHAVPITIVGLGPGDGRYLTREAWEFLASLDVLYLRTERHPAVSDLPADVRLISFDHLYESATDFAEVYEKIVDSLLRLAREASASGLGVAYAVPGHPLIGESTVTMLIAAAEEEGVTVEVISGLSFVEPVLEAIGVDGLDGLQLFDSVEIARYNHPPLNTDVPLLLGQVYDRLLANELKLSLMALYPDEHEVVLIHAAGTESHAIERVPLYEIDRRESLAHLSSMYVPPLPQGSTLTALAETVAYLRGPDGCPWDQEQTPLSLRSGFIEEFSEVMDALDAADMPGLQEELGDLLYHVVMQAQMAGESGEFTLTDVISGIEAKLKRRHPHVWGDWTVENSEEVIRNWEELKVAEKPASSGPRSLLDNVPHSLPSLARSQTIQDRVAEIGFEWPSLDGVMAKLEEELSELKAADTHVEQQAELGDVLFVIANWARKLTVEAEIALREANGRFDLRFRKMEDIARDNGLSLTDMGLQEMDEIWEEAKSALSH